MANSKMISDFFNKLEGLLEKLQIKDNPDGTVTKQVFLMFSVLVKS